MARYFWRRMRKSKGFTLVEVLIALMIIAIALTAVIRATTASTRATIHLRDTITAHWVGMNILSEIQTQMIALSPGEDLPPGKTEMMGKTWRWTVSTESSDAFTDVVKVTVFVHDDHQHLINTVVGYAKI